jgi:hypothetical protein
MKSLRWTVLAALGLCLTVLPSLSAEVKTAEKPPVKPTENSKYIAQLDTAYSLITYGKDNNDPLAVLTAAEILYKTPTRPLALKYDSPEAKMAAEKGLAKTEDPNSPLKLVQYILTEMKPSAEVKALAKKLETDIKSEKKLDLNGGPFTGQFIMEPGETALYPAMPRGGEHTTVTARVLGPGELQLTVSDPKEGLSETEVGPVCRIRFFQRETGKVNVIRKNLSRTPIRVYLYIP